MSQEAFLQDLDARIVGALQSAGLADLATYTPPGDDPVAIPNCRVVIDHAVARFGEDPAALVGAPTTARLELAQIASPERGGTLTIGARIWRLEDPLGREPGISERWAVVRV